MKNCESDGRSQKRMVGRKAVVRPMGDERREIAEDKRTRIEIEKGNYFRNEIRRRQQYHRENQHLLLPWPRLFQKIQNRDRRRDEQKIFGGEDDKSIHND